MPTPREKRCLEGCSIVDCCIVNSGDYIFIAQQEGVYDPWEELPPTHFVTYRVR